jgi:hypothetical protein
MIGIAFIQAILVTHHSRRPRDDILEDPSAALGAVLVAPDARVQQRSPALGRCRIVFCWDQEADHRGDDQDGLSHCHPRTEPPLDPTTVLVPVEGADYLGVEGL